MCVGIPMCMSVLCACVRVCMCVCGSMCTLVLQRTIFSFSLLLSIVTYEYYYQLLSSLGTFIIDTFDILPPICQRVNLAFQVPETNSWWLDDLRSRGKMSPVWPSVDSPQAHDLTRHTDRHIKGDYSVKQIGKGGLLVDMQLYVMRYWYFRYGIFSHLSVLTK